MSNLVPVENNVPAHIAARFGGVANTDLSANVGMGGYPIISCKGKVWHVVRGDERTLITNDEGDPRSNLEVVIVKSNPHLSKVFYQSGYEEGSQAKPTCYSNDGTRPADDAQTPQAEKCAVCPNNVWGSRITDNGSKGKACSDSRRLAVAPVADLENPMLLRVPAASLKDLTAYAEMLTRRRAPYQAVVTKVGFDHSVAHPQFTFKVVRWLTDEEADTVARVMESDLVASITGMAAEPAIEGTPPARAVETAAKPEPKAKPAAARKAEPAPKAAPVMEEEEVPAPVTDKPRSRVDAVLADANASLDDILASLSMDD